MTTANSEDFDVKPPPPDGLTYNQDENYVKAHLDEDGDKYYKLEKDEIEFFSSQTGIKDPEELKKHILNVQREAYDVHPYPCIRRLGFARTKISRLPAYQDLLRLGRERDGALFLDIGCCVGNDVRKATADGFPVKQALASDLHAEFWDIGHKLFKTTPDSFPVPFLAGDAFDSAFLALEPIPASPPTTPCPDISTLTTLTPLVGRLSAIHASSFFHLFTEEKQLELAKRLAALLSPEPGSVIFGMHGGRPEKGLRIEAVRANSHGVRMFCHSPESWEELWQKDVFGEGKVKVWTKLFEVERDDLLPVGSGKFYFLVWSVTRL